MHIKMISLMDGRKGEALRVQNNVVLRCTITSKALPSHLAGDFAFSIFSYGRITSSHPSHTYYTIAGREKARRFELCACPSAILNHEA